MKVFEIIFQTRTKKINKIYKKIVKEFYINYIIFIIIYKDIMDP